MLHMLRSLFCASTVLIVAGCADLSASSLDFETLDPTVTSASGINDNGVIVGTSGSSGFIRDSSGTYQYFNYASQTTTPSLTMPVI
jgi:hypothetical protein